jgi:zinc protease
MRVLLITLLSLFSWQTYGQVQQLTLDNGLKILVKEDHRAPIAVAMVWYNVGSADEPGGVTGVAHSLEHLMFKGTKKYPQGVFAKRIAALGGQDNAFTNNDYTAYYEKMAATHLPISFELEADRMQNLLFNAEEFDKEIKVIQEERRLRTDDNPQALTFERFLATAHLTAPYNHPVIGWMSDLQQMRVSDAKAWYQRFYVPSNATLVVVGDIKPDEVFALAKKYFGPIGNYPAIERKAQKEPPRLGKKTVEVHAPAQVPLLLIGYMVPTVKTVTAEHAIDPYALEVLAGVLDAGDSARVSAQLVRGLQVASNVDVYYNLYSRYETQFILYGVPSQAHTPDELKQGILTELKRLQTELVPEKELKRVKAQIVAQKTFERDSIFSQAMELGLLETLGLGWQTAEKYVERINSVTPKQLQQVAQRYFQENNMTEALLIPEPIGH